MIIYPPTLPCPPLFLGRPSCPLASRQPRIDGDRFNGPAGTRSSTQWTAVYRGPGKTFDVEGLAPCRRYRFRARLLTSAGPRKRTVWRCVPVCGRQCRGFSRYMNLHLRYMFCVDFKLNRRGFKRLIRLCDDHLQQKGTTKEPKHEKIRRRKRTVVDFGDVSMHNIQEKHANAGSTKN